MVEVTKEEKLGVLLQDIRKPKDTMHSRTDTDAPGGRYSSLGKPVITGSTPGPQYPRLPSGPWSQSIDEVSAPEPLVDGSDCGDTYIGEPLGNPAEIEATSAPSTPCAQTGRRGSHALASPPAEERPASPGGVSNQPNFRRRI